METGSSRRSSTKRRAGVCSEVPTRRQEAHHPPRLPSVPRRRLPGRRPRRPPRPRPRAPGHRSAPGRRALPRVARGRPVALLRDSHRSPASGRSSYRDDPHQNLLHREHAPGDLLHSEPVLRSGDDSVSGSSALCWRSASRRARASAKCRSLPACSFAMNATLSSGLRFAHAIFAYSAIIALVSARCFLLPASLSPLYLR